MKVLSEHEREFTFAICCRLSVCRLSLCLSSVTLVHPTQTFVNFGNFSTAFGSGAEPQSKSNLVHFSFKI